MMTENKYITFVSTLSGTEIKVPVEVFRKFITTDYEPQPYWYHKPKYKKLIEKYLDLNGDEDKLNEEEKKQIKYYMLMFAENIAFSSYLMLLEKTKNKMKQELFMKKQLEMLEKIRKVYKEGTIDDLYEICQEYGIDPI